MYAFSEIQTVHLEITSKCNARCPMCLRTVLGGAPNPHLPLTELNLEDVQQIFTPTFLRQLKRIYLCGNYGDPIMANDTLEALRYFRRENPQIDLELFTNGSARDENWWRDLAGMVNRCRFGIDGLADTNAIYRRGTKWPILERNLRAYLAAGGVADWDFIVFRHNEHQIEEARAFAQSLGFRAFNVKKTGRFFSNTKVSTKIEQEVRNAQGELEYVLEPPEDPRYLNSALQKEREITAAHGSMKNFFAQTPIHCKVAKERSVYVSAEGLIFPCCWTANQLYPWYFAERGTPIWRLIEKLPRGLESLNAKRQSVSEIVDGDFFQHTLPNHWRPETEAAARLFVCAKTCGQGFDAFSAQFQTTAAPTAGMNPPMVPARA